MKETGSTVLNGITYKLHGLTVFLKKSRDSNWESAFKGQLESMDKTIFPESLPEFCIVVGGHYLLSKLEIHRNATIVESLTAFDAIKGSKHDDDSDMDDPYWRMNRGFRDTDDEEEDDDDDEEENNEIGHQFGLTRVSYTKQNLVTIIENVIQNDYCWDIGCQVQQYCHDTKKNGNKYTRKCFCPLGKFHKKWREHTGVDCIVDEGDIPLCNKGEFNSPHSLWAHCRDVGRNCLVHYSFQKILEKCYDCVVTKNTYQ